MKTVLKLILVDLLVTQIVAPSLVAIPTIIYSVATQENWDMEEFLMQGVAQSILIPAQLTGQLLMIAYLWKGKYFDTGKAIWSPVSATYPILALVAIFTGGFLASELTDLIPGIPDIMERTFGILQAGWVGILTIVLIGPVMEELLFRGAIARLLLQRFRHPAVGILLSAFLFGLMHLNPAQMLPAFLIGILLAWVYYRTRSLTICILMHIFNNAFSVYINVTFPEVEKIREFFHTDGAYTAALAVAVLLLITSLIAMKKVPRSSRGGHGTL
ncbi:MAG: CPBP family intramembrane metalloprotease [Mediterranea sp.]|jgi:membrane protease YdiL (CAAX protease family)|nr:CPBP family intramembrane metalloprotease [Mediterranea sp.]